MYRSKKGFTLVELIVVITILAILATIAFVSFQGFSVSARDSARLNDVKVIEKGLGLYRTKGNPLPLPDDAITVTVSGTTIFYQGYAGTGVLTTLKQAGDIVNPLLNEPYTYAIAESKNYFQLLAFLEKQIVAKNLIYKAAQTYALNHNEMHPRVYGDPIGILLNPNNYSPLQQTSHTGNTIDISSTNDEYVAYIDNTSIFQGTGTTLSYIAPNGSCKRILELGQSNGSGLYSINPDGTEEFEVYCDMETDGGGWIYWQGGIIDEDTLDQDFIDYNTASGSIYRGFNKFYRLDIGQRRKMKFSESKSVHAGNDSQYKNHIQYGFITSLPNNPFGKRIKKYTVENTLYQNGEYELFNCELSLNNHITCSGRDETQHPWYQRNKVYNHGSGNYGVHTCLRYIGPNGEWDSTCNLSLSSDELFLGACQGDPSWKNYITHPGCDFRSTPGNYYQWQEWVR